ncbi:MAG: BBE domain-containing protein [Chitinophagaceae bacterium]|nr:BBE domain-containing protein [Oligoflexus sp.]
MKTFIAALLFLTSTLSFAQGRLATLKAIKVYFQGADTDVTTVTVNGVVTNLSACQSPFHHIIFEVNSDEGGRSVLTAQIIPNLFGESRIVWLDNTPKDRPFQDQVNLATDRVSNTYLGGAKSLANESFQDMLNQALCTTPKSPGLAGGFFGLGPLSCDVYKKKDWKDSNLDWIDSAAALLGDRKAAFYNHINRDILGLDKTLYFGSSWNRLQTIKTAVDPQFIFAVFRDGTDASVDPKKPSQEA